MVYFFILLICGVVFYIYTIYCFKKKRVLYTIENNLIILKDTHFKLQKKVGLVNLIAFILIGISMFFIKEEYKAIYIPIIVGFYWISNYIMKDISIRRGYSIMKSHTE